MKGVWGKLFREKVFPKKLHVLFLRIQLGLHTGGDGLFGDFTGLFERDAGQQRTDKFIDENGKQSNAADDNAGFAERKGSQRHTEGNAGLRKERDAEVLLDGRLGLHELRGDVRTDNLTGRAEEDVNHADEDDCPVAEDGELEVGTADNEEQHHDRTRPAVHTLHKFFGEITEVAEDGTHHHADEERGEFDGHGAEVEFRHGQRNREENVSDGNGHTLAAGVEELFGEVKQQADQRTENQGCNNFHQRIYNNGDDIKRAVFQSLGNPEGDRKHDQTDHVVERNDGKEHLGQRAVRLVLLDDHERCGGSRSRSDRTERNGAGQRELVGHDEVKQDQRDVHEDRRNDCLEDRNHNRLAADVLEFRKTELVAHRHRDKAESRFGNDRVGRNVLMRDKTKSGNTELSETVRTDQNPGNQICGDGGEIPDFRQSGHHQAGKHRNGKSEQGLHNHKASIL